MLLNSELVIGPPKSRTSRRTVVLDEQTVAVLRDHNRHQCAMRRRAANDWYDTGLVFTRQTAAPSTQDGSLTGSASSLWRWDCLESACTTDVIHPPLLGSPAAKA